MHDHATILSYIESRRNEAVECLQRMVSFDSSTIHHGLDGQELAIQEWLAGVLTGWGLETRLFEPDNAKMQVFPDFSPGHSYRNRPNLVATLMGAGKRPFADPQRPRGHHARGRPLRSGRTIPGAARSRAARCTAWASAT